MRGNTHNIASGPFSAPYKAPSAQLPRPIDYGPNVPIKSRCRLITSPLTKKDCRLSARARTNCFTLAFRSPTVPKSISRRNGPSRRSPVGRYAASIVFYNGGAGAYKCRCFDRFAGPDRTGYISVTIVNKSFWWRAPSACHAPPIGGTAHALAGCRR